MSRPRTPTRIKAIKWLTENPDKQITYSDLAKRLGSHPIAIGQIMKFLGNDLEYKDLTKRVVQTRKRRRMTIVSKPATEPEGV
jgi:hypothetical protein